MKRYLILALLVVLEVLLVIFIFNQIKFNKKNKNAEQTKDIVEAITLMSVVFFVCFYYLKGSESPATIYTIIIIVEFLVLILWYLLKKVKGVKIKALIKRLRSSDK